MYYAQGNFRAVDSYHGPTAYLKKGKTQLQNLLMAAFFILFFATERE